MPKTIDLADEILKMEAGFPPSRRQLQVRVDNTIAVLLFRDCLARGVLPAHQLEAILTDYYTTWNQGVHLPLAPKMRQVLDEIAAAYDVDRETVVQLILAQYLDQAQEAAAKKVRQRTARSKELNRLLDDEKPGRTRSSRSASSR